MGKHFTATLCLVWLSYSIEARAEFSMLSPGLPDRDDTRPSETAAVGRAAQATFTKASGFGSQVPLAFAARQIVPPGVSVRYGPGADPAMLVDWKGGAPWDQVLKASVKPAGLHVVVTWHAVQIRK